MPTFQPDEGRFMPPFSARFPAAWQDPTPERLVALLHDEVVLKQPNRPTIRGKQAALSDFQRLFAWLPGLHGSDFSHQADEGDTCFIEWTLRIPVGHEVGGIPMVDRFRVQDGLGIERVVYFDQVALVALLIRHPGLWPGYLRYWLASRSNAQSCKRENS